MKNNKLINKTNYNHELNNSKNNVSKNNDGSLFGSYKQKIKVRMAKKLMKQREVYHGNDEIKHLKINCAIKEFENNEKCVLQGNNHFNNNAVNFINNKNNTNSSNSTNNTFNNNTSNNNKESIHKIKKNILSTPPSTSTSTTTSNMTPLKPRRIPSKDVQESSCNDLTLWHNIGINGGEIYFENFGIHIFNKIQFFCENNLSLFHKSS